MGRIWLLVLSSLTLFPAVAAAMGVSGGGVPTSIPEPARSYVVTATDQQGTQTRLEHFSIEGRVHLSGKRGKATLSIPFERIQLVQLRSVGDRVNADVILSDGRTVKLSLDGRQQCYGRMDYANFRINLRDLEKLVYHGEVGK